MLTNSLSAMPINFGRNQAPLVYEELITPHFHIYYDERAPGEARGVLSALTRARPVVEGWLQVKREGPLPVVISATTDNASFANFITDAIELQTMGEGGRDLAWHEYVHSTMYRHLDNIFGPAGSIINLPWMPAWWIEGLAEALSLSVGAGVQSAIERELALSGRWPSWDKLHSLYGQGRFALTGYAVSGAFVSWILRQHSKPDGLPVLLEDFRDYSMPWWWPWAFVPFNGFMPMDAGLENLTGKSGEELYEDYKAWARRYWMKHSPGGKKDQLFFKKTLPSLARIRPPGGRWLSLGTGTIHVRRETNNDLQRSDLLILTKKGQATEDGRPLLRRRALIERLFLTRSRLVWIEFQQETARLCSLPIKSFNNKKSYIKKAVRCTLKTKQPSSLAVLGSDTAAQRTKTIWLRHTTETLAGDQHRIIIHHPESGRSESMTLTEGGRPVAMARHQGKLLAVVQGRQEYRLRALDESGACLEERRTPARVTRLLVRGQKLQGMVAHRRGHSLLPLQPDTMPSGDCAAISDQDSPLLYAMRRGPGTSLKEALAMGWPGAPAGRQPEARARRQAALQAAGPLDQDKTTAKVRKGAAQWRPRPLFAFPWLGADAEGSQLGFISIPLMDGMQNETLRLNLLWGVNSRFLDSELLFQTGRFRTSWETAVFRRQTFNGTFAGQVLYYEEVGGRVAAARYFVNPGLSLDLGFKSAWFKPRLGPPNFIIEGQENQFSMALSKSTRFSLFTWSNRISGSAVPEWMNKVWIYNKLNLSTSISIPVPLGSWRMTTLSTGLSGSRTRGKNPKYLKEVYRPLRTFVPGTGGGLNEINVSLTGPGLLTSAVYGDTMARAKVSWTLPLIPDIEKLIGIFYLERLDLTAFYNYGGAWNGPEPPPAGDLVAAHGYNLDLQTDIKGVTVNAGVGIGQVAGHDFETWFLFGFDALIDQASH